MSNLHNSVGRDLKKTTRYVIIWDSRSNWELFFFFFLPCNKSKGSFVLSCAAVKKLCSRKLLSLATVANCVHEWTNLLKRLYLNQNTVPTYECGVSLWCVCACMLGFTCLFLSFSWLTWFVPVVVCVVHALAEVILHHQKTSVTLQLSVPWLFLICASAIRKLT